MSDLYKYLKTYRIFRNITQEDLAKILGKSKNVISNWENGLNRPDADSIELICKTLIITPNHLFGWEPLPEYELQKETLRKMNEEIENLKKKIEYNQNELRKLEEHHRQLRGEQE